jgi:hypothetical protein
MNFPLDVSTCRVLIIFVPNNYVGRNEWQSKRQGWPRRGSEDQVRDAMQQGKARRPRQCARHRVRMGRMPRARGRQQTLMYVSCVYHVYHVCICAMMYVRIICVLVLWTRLTTVLVHICSRTPCLQTRLVKRRSRKCTDVTRGQSQFGFSCRQASRWPEDLCWCPWRPAIKHESTHPGLVPGTRLRIAHASLPGNSGPAQLAAGYIYTHHGQLARRMPTANSRVCGLSVFIIR